MTKGKAKKERVVAFGCMFLIVCWVVLFADTHRLNRGGK